MYTAKITSARYAYKFFHLQSGAMVTVNKPRTRIFLGPNAQAPSDMCTVSEEANPIYGRVRCPILFKGPVAPGGMPMLPLKLGDELHYEVKGGDIYLLSISRQPISAQIPSLSASQQTASNPSQPNVVHGSCSKLMAIGFENVARWILGKDGKISHQGDDQKAWNSLITRYPQALYAFCVDGDIQYIGKTISTLQGRFGGYRAPGKGQTTNLKCNEKITEALKDKKDVRILVLPNRVPLNWGGFQINIAAGLEDALIDVLQPDWNA